MSLTAATIINVVCSMVLLVVSIINIYFLFINRTLPDGEVKGPRFVQDVLAKPWIAWGMVGVCVVLVITMFWQVMALSQVNSLECRKK